MTASRVGVRRPRGLVGGLVLIALLSLVAGVSPATAAHEQVTWGTGSSQVIFGEEMRFEQPVTLEPLAVRRVELLVQLEGEAGARVREVQGSGELTGGTLRGTFDLVEDHVYPNTDVVARFRITAEDGHTSVSPDIALTYRDERFAWRTVEGQTAAGSTVRVHWYDGGDGFGRRALEIARQGISKSETRLGVTERDPIDFYIYAETRDFYGALGPGSRENVGGVALPWLRTLYALISPDEIDDDWVEEVVPHELAHLVFDTATDNPYHHPPKWLNEGLAVYESEGYTASDRFRVAQAVDGKRLIPLVGLAGLFPTRYEEFALAYAESVSAVDFMVRMHGPEALVRLVRSYAEGITDDEAFQAAIGMTVAEFDAAWQRDLGVAPPVAYGPQPPPPGPLPSGWSRGPDGAPQPTPSPTGRATAAPATPAPSTGPQATVGPTEAPTGTPATTSEPAPSTTAAATGVTPVPTLPISAPSGRTDGADNRTLGLLLGGIALILAVVGFALILNNRRAPSDR